MDAELLIDAFDMKLDRVLRHYQLFGNGRIRFSTSDESKHLTLARGKAGLLGNTRTLRIEDRFTIFPQNLGRKRRRCRPPIRKLAKTHTNKCIFDTIVALLAAIIRLATNRCPP